MEKSRMNDTNYKRSNLNIGYSNLFNLYMYNNYPRYLNNMLCSFLYGTSLYLFN